MAGLTLQGSSLGLRELFSADPGMGVASAAVKP